MMNEDLIKEFRDAVNANDFVLFKYKNNQDRNHWNCICSAMDWITVAIEYISKDHHKREDSIEVFAYISSIDIVIEAVQQLYRVLCNTKKTLFAEDKDIFADNQFGQTDIEYFKTIRACFGAHPVNLDEPSETHNKSKRRFASWSGNGFGKGDYSIILYSNQPDGDYIYLDINFKQLNAFLIMYYSYLETLINEIERQYNEFRSKMASRKFKCEGKPLIRLAILGKECALRLNNDYYRTIIDELCLIYETPVSCDNNIEMVVQYKNALTKLIDEISDNLQNMKIRDLEYNSILDPRPEGLQNGWGYWYEKLSQYIFGSGYPPQLWLKNIEEIFKRHFVFEYDNYNELYLLVKAALYKLSLNSLLNK